MSAVDFGYTGPMPTKTNRACPVIARAFHKSVNMSPGEIRRWAKNPKAKLASFASTRRRLPALAALKQKAPAQWTDADCRFAQRVLNFNKRMGGMAEVHGCTLKINVALRNWGRKAPGCGGV